MMNEMPPGYRTVTDPVTGVMVLWRGRARIGELTAEYADLAYTLLLAAAEVGCIASSPSGPNGVCGVIRKVGPFCGFHAPLCLYESIKGETCGENARPGRLTCNDHHGMVRLQRDMPDWVRLRKQAREWLETHRIASPQSRG